MLIKRTQRTHEALFIRLHKRNFREGHQTAPKLSVKIFENEGAIRDKATEMLLKYLKIASKSDKTDHIIV